MVGRRPSLTDFSREGDWTPEIADDSLDGSGEGQAYLRQVGRWTKTGNRVLFNCRVAISDLGTLTTTQQARVVGLPYNSVNITESEASIYVGFAALLSITAGHSVTGNIPVNGNYIDLRLWDATGGVTALLISELSVDGDLIISGQYEIG